MLYFFIIITPHKWFRYCQKMNQNHFLKSDNTFVWWTKSVQCYKTRVKHQSWQKINCEETARGSECNETPNKIKLHLFPFSLFFIKWFPCFPSQQSLSPFTILTGLIIQHEADALLPRCPLTIIAILHSSFPMEQWEKLHTSSMLLIVPLGMEMRH